MSFVGLPRGMTDCHVAKLVTVQKKLHCDELRKKHLRKGGVGSGRSVAVWKKNDTFAPTNDKLLNRLPITDYQITGNVCAYECRNYYRPG